MGQIIKLANGSVETILNPNDFEDILDKYLGTGAADYFHEIRKKAEQADKFKQQVDTLEEEIYDLEIAADNYQANYDSLEEEYEEYRLNHE
jgi:uncharacterized coiled-coil DUF342 family protein